MSDLKEAAEAAFLLLQKRYSGDKDDFVVMSALATALMEPVAVGDGAIHAAWSAGFVEGEKAAMKQQTEPVSLINALNFFTEAERVALWKRGNYSDSAIANITQAVLNKIRTDPPQQQAEPVAWTLTKTLNKRETTTRGFLWFSNPQNCSWTPLYTTPPQRKPLTDEEIEQAYRHIYRNVPADFDHTTISWIEQGIRYAERAHGIKGKHE